MNCYRFAVLFAVTASLAGTAQAQRLSKSTLLTTKVIPLPVVSLVPSSTCWDANQNGTCDLPDEDFNGDGACDWTDCHDEFLDWMATGACANMGPDARCDATATTTSKSGLPYAYLLLTTAEVQGAGPAVDLALLGIRQTYGQSVPVYDHSVESIQMRTWGADVLALSFDTAEQALAQKLKQALAAPVQTAVHVQCFTTSTGVAVQALGPNGIETTQVTTLSLMTNPAALMSWVAWAVEQVR